MTPLENDLRKQLGVPDGAASVLILGMDAHMDWDWLNTFQTLVYDGNSNNGNINRSVREIINQAWAVMIKNQQSTNPYLYSVCEMGFLRAALELNPDLVTQFKTHNLNKQLSIEGGGITSPDNLLPHGEAFIRNYLVGWAWQLATLGLQSIYAYMPDDFGHDAQLPVMLEAMGFAGVSFSRIPGSWASSQTSPLDPKLQSLYAQLTAPGGADLFWQASDGSSVFAHLEQNSYCQGSSLGNYCANPKDAIGDVNTYLNYNQPSSPSPYVYVPCGCDFALPIPCLLEIAAAYNAQAPTPTTHAVVGTLEQYIQLVTAWSANNPGKLASRMMDPTPYWTGFYASRPANKILHQGTVRALLGAEVFGVIADALQTNDTLAWESVSTARSQAIAQGWESLLPSTHHDYITGTAVDSVYSEEQVPLLQAAYAIGDGARKTAIQEIATLINATPGANETPVVVFNQLGFEVTGLVEIPALPGQTFQSVRSDDNVTGPVQLTPDGKLLFMATAPSLGYATYYLSEQPNTTSLVSVKNDGAFIGLQNSQMLLVVSQAANWGINSWQPKVNGSLQSDLIPKGQAANALTFYNDQGNLYNFGNEFDAAGLAVVTGKFVPGAAKIIESGPLRAKIQAPVSFSDGRSQADYIIEYTLVGDEPFWRSAVTGSAPLPPDPNNPPMNSIPYAVMVRFPFKTAVDNVLRGTPYHWYNELPVPYWEGPTFQATHHFVVPSTAGNFLAALYHADVPAWAIDDNGAMIGCILRNTPATYPWPESDENRGANGVDFGVHTRRYAGRIPQGIAQSPSGLVLFEESLSYTTPLQGAYVNVPTAGVSPDHPVNVAFPKSFSVASVTNGDAILTVAKQGQFNPAALILRLYQPTNASETVTLSLADYIQAGQKSTPQVIPVTALEQPIAGAQPIPVTNGQITLQMDRALATLAITPVETPKVE